MSVAVPGLNAEQVAQVAGGDMGALERLFRAAYPSLFAEAKKLVNDDSAASRVVQKVVIHLYDDRATLNSPDAVASRLGGLTHEIGTREAIRLEGLHAHTGMHPRAKPHVLSIDEIWAHVVSAISGPANGGHPDASEMFQHSRHEAANHIKAMAKPVSWTPRIVIAAIAIAVTAVGLHFYGKAEESGRLALALSKPAASEITTGMAQLGNTSLDSNATAYVGAESKLTIPKGYNREVRGVGIRGAARFTVAGDAMRFEVISANVHAITDSGVFAVSSYPEQQGVMVRVTSGTVEVKTKGDKSGTHVLEAGQAMAFAADGSASTPTDTEVAEIFGFADGTFALNNRTLREALTAMKKWYGTDIVLKDTSLVSRMVTLTAPMDSQGSVISALEEATGLEAVWEDKQMVLREPRARPRRR